ncbi:MAG: 3-phosphoshikimate 1-carboxyvinyltransferase [Clostridia bacterium]|nr:3-phosphoshikimate 1-carboxyvinyltransferase [Clostridia bacterium]
MKLTINKGQARGRVSVPPSKSIAHRLLICAAMCCDGESLIRNLPSCEDVLATIDCLSALGVKIDYDGKDAKVIGVDMTTAQASEPLCCRESGSTLRFLIPIAMLSGHPATLQGSERLIARPQDVYEQLFKECGLKFSKSAESISVCGKLEAGEYFIDGNVSSQFITGLFLALSTLSGDSKIIVNTEIESRPYVDMTIAAMRKFGVKIFPDTDWSFYIFGGPEYKSRDIAVEGDWSAGAFLHALNCLGGKVKVDGLDKDSIQGDKICIKHMSKLNKGYAEIDITNCPDLGPILFAVAAAKHGAKFVGTKRLRDKESDRIEAMKAELEKFGAELIVEENSVTVVRHELHAPSATLYGHNDHRIVMSLAVLCTLYGGEIEGCEAVNKSYPEFFDHLMALGIKISAIDN